MKKKIQFRRLVVTSFFTALTLFNSKAYSQDNRVHTFSSTFGVTTTVDLELGNKTLSYLNQSCDSSKVTPSPLSSSQVKTLLSDLKMRADNDTENYLQASRLSKMVQAGVIAGPVGVAALVLIASATVVGGVVAFGLSWPLLSTSIEAFQLPPRPQTSVLFMQHQLSIKNCNSQLLLQKIQTDRSLLLKKFDDFQFTAMNRVMLGTPLVKTLEEIMFLSQLELAVKLVEVAQSSTPSKMTNPSSDFKLMCSFGSSWLNLRMYEFNPQKNSCRISDDTLTCPAGFYYGSNQQDWKIDSDSNSPLILNLKSSSGSELDSICHWILSP